MRAIAPISLAAVIFAFGCGGTDTPTGPAAPAKNSPPAASPSPSPTKPTGTKHGRIYFATASAGGMSISTDKDDYSPGDTVHFTGAGWTANDTLAAVLTEDSTGVKLAWTIPVAADGTFRDSTYVVSPTDVGARFTLTVTSKSDPTQTLTVVFTDGSAVLTISSITPATPAPGDGITANLSVNFNGCNVPTPCPNWKGTKFSIDAGTAVCVNTTDFLGGTAAHTETASVGTTLTAPAAGGHTLHAQLFTDDACTDATGGVKDFAFTVSAAALPVLTVAKVATDQNAGSNADTDPDFFYGVEGQYTLTVTNSGTVATDGTTITVQDVLPNDLTFNSATGSGWSCAAVTQTVTCTSTAMIAASGGTSTITIKVIPNTVGNDVSNTASVSGGGDATSATSDAEVVDILPAPTPA